MTILGANVMAAPGSDSRSNEAIQCQSPVLFVKTTGCEGTSSRSTRSAGWQNARSEQEKEAAQQLQRVQDPNGRSKVRGKDRPWVDSFWTGFGHPAFFWLPMSAQAVVAVARNQRGEWITLVSLDMACKARVVNQHKARAWD